MLGAVQATILSSGVSIPTGATIALGFESGSLVNAGSTGGSATYSTGSSPYLHWGRDGVVQNHNMLTYSQTFSDVSWGKNTSAGSTITPTYNYGVAPDGTTTAARFQFAITGLAGSYSQLSHGFTATVGLTYTYSIWIKSLSGTPTIDFGNLNGTFNQYKPTITTDWVRYSYTWTVSNSTTGAGPLLRADSGTSNSADILIWGAQIERRASAGTYVPTTSTALYQIRTETAGASGGCVYGPEESSSNVFLNSTGTAAVTQNISVTTANSGKWTCSVIGAGTVTSSAGTAIATGYGAATSSTANTITVTGNGTVTYTVSGADATTRVMVENKSYPTTWVQTLSASVSRPAEDLTITGTGAFGASAGTVSGWVNVLAGRSWADATSSPWLFGLVSASTNNMVGLYKSTNTIVAKTTNSSGTASTHSVTTTLSAGWHHLALTYDASALTLYIDGVAQASPVASPNIPSSIGATAHVGADYAGANPVSAPMDSVRTYSRALTATEVKALYTKRS